MKYAISDYVFETDSEYMISITQGEYNSLGTVVDIRIDFGDTIHPETVKICWQTLSGGIYTLWRGMGMQHRRIHPNWGKLSIESRAASDIPIMSYIGKGGSNKVTVAVSDIKSPIKLESGVIEENANIEWRLTLFENVTEAMRSYSAKLLIITKDMPYDECIDNVVKWWNGFGIKYCHVPEAAFDPVYSTWYSYHQNVTTEAMLKELEAASKIGMKTVIIDDGWQTDDSSRGYAYCGEWTTATTKISDMKNFVKRVHDLGMRIMLWYSVPYVGAYSPVFERFKDKLLNPDCERKYFVLDPRYPEVREYLVKTYENAVNEWDIDGMKLDFVDAFKLYESSNPFSEQMDTASVETAVCILLCEIHKRVMAIKPDILIEFRQSYISPIMLRYGNMFRVCDCPMDPVTNRVGSINLRLTSGDRAVHSDMIMWDAAAAAETAAQGLINALFSVPQISMRINELSEEHYKMLKTYLGVWNENREVLSHGELKAESPEANYSIVTARKNSQLAAVAYSNPILTLTDKLSKITFVNGTGKDRLYIENKGNAVEYKCTIITCTGEYTMQYDLLLHNGVNVFTVPVSGIIKLEKENSK